MLDKTKDLLKAAIDAIELAIKMENESKADNVPAVNSVQVTDNTTSPSLAGTTTRRSIPWGASVSQEFLASCQWIEDQLGLKTEYLMACMKFESNLKPDAKNLYSSGSGLIQFMESTARRLGTTTTDLRSMSGTRQLSYVYKYFKEYKDRGFKLHNWSLSDTYMAILWPAAIGKPDDFRVFVNDPNKQKDAYDVNKGLDADKDGFVTKSEAAGKVNRLYSEGFKAGNVGYL